MGQNFTDDFGSRHPVSCDNKENCRVCSFVEECSNLIISTLSFKATEDSIIGQIDVGNLQYDLVNEILRGNKTVPFNNRNAMRYIQEHDPILQRVRELLKAGQSPGHRDKTQVKRYMYRHNNLTIAKDGCIVSNKRNKNTFVSRELIVLPESVSQ